MGKKKLALLISAVILAVGSVLFEFGQPLKPQMGNFVVLPGENFFLIAQNLKAEGYIKSKILFIAQMLSSGNLRNLKAGKYDLSGQNDYAIIQKLSRGQTVPVGFTVIPGWSLNNVANNLEAKNIIPKKDFLAFVLAPGGLKEEFDFLSDAPEDAGLEGYLFPDTYHIAANPESGDIARQMLENFSNKLTPEIGVEIKKQNKTIFDIVIMASLVEKEVRTKEDKAIVAGILWKRAAKGWPLQVDSTLLYFLVSDHPSLDDKYADSLYNTYKYGGLPKGPICNPGIESIEAAVYPVASDYFFYLSAKDGKTVFSKTYGEHLVNIAKYLNN